MVSPIALRWSARLLAIGFPFPVGAAATFDAILLDLTMWTWLAMHAIPRLEAMLASPSNSLLAGSNCSQARVCVPLLDGSLQHCPMSSSTCHADICTCAAFEDSD